MNDPEHNFDENLATVLRASLGPDVRPSPAARERLRRELRAVVRAKARPREFPVSVLGLLTGLMLVLIGWGVARWVGTMPMGGVTLAVWILIALNAACLPASGAVIFLRRKHA